MYFRQRPDIAGYETKKIQEEWIKKMARSIESKIKAAAELEKLALETEARNKAEIEAIESAIPLRGEEIDIELDLETSDTVRPAPAPGKLTLDQIRAIRATHRNKPQVKKLCAYSFAGIANLDRVVAELPPKAKFHTVESTLADGSYRGIMLKKVHGEWQLLEETYDKEAFKSAVQSHLHPRDVTPQPQHVVRSYGYVRQKVRPLAAAKQR